MRIILPILALALVAGCSSTKDLAESLDTRQNAGACPPVGSVYDASRIVDFRDGSDELYTDIRYTGEITDVRSFCRYTGDNPVEADLEVDFAFGKGAAADSNTHDFTYWVAVTRRNGKVLAKEYYTVRAEFAGNARLDGATTKFDRITIPRADETIAASNFEILVGFDLSEEELEFNRAGKRFRMDAGS
ncbi:hypothetical protein [Hyphomonas sp.]|uniref:hypothetical protein n=1 Tax=Hyphomonas sp. TaxID=87 RepID=UPI003527AF4F